MFLSLFRSPRSCPSAPSVWAPRPATPLVRRRVWSHVTGVAKVFILPVEFILPSWSHITQHMGGHVMSASLVLSVIRVPVKVRRAKIFLFVSIVTKGSTTPAFNPDQRRGPR